MVMQATSANTTRVQQTAKAQQASMSFASDAFAPKQLMQRNARWSSAPSLPRHRAHAREYLHPVCGDTDSVVEIQVNPDWDGRLLFLGRGWPQRAGSAVIGPSTAQRERAHHLLLGRALLVPAFSWHVCLGVPNRAAPPPALRMWSTNQQSSTCKKANPPHNTFHPGRCGSETLL